MASDGQEKGEGGDRELKHGQKLALEELYESHNGELMDRKCKGSR